MEKGYSLPFTNGVEEMLITMVGISCAVKEGLRDPSSNHISGTILFSGASNGRLTMLFPEETAKKIVSKMLGMDETEMDEETLKDGVGEMANIVAGNAKAALSNTPYRFSLSLPSVRVGMEPFPEGVDGEDCLLTTELGDFRLMFFLALAEE